ncbi:MAG: hypothetical protein QNJ44_13320 [Rhodobacter sp.]|nr:hypothetical protein [Rhodobacter sp.]
MIVRLVLRRAINSGINAGVDMATRRNRQTQDPEAGREQQAQGRETARRAKQAMRMGRRIGRL